MGYVESDLPYENNKVLFHINPHFQNIFDPPEWKDKYKIDAG